MPFSMFVQMIQQMDLNTWLQLCGYKPMYSHHYLMLINPAAACLTLHVSC